MKKLILALIFLIFGLQSQVWATAESDFPLCANPSGEIRAKYDSGVHGVIGDEREYQGADTVYSLGSGDYTQCLCPLSGDGIQTNWMNAQNIPEDDQKILISKGWIYTPDGSVWGLDSTAYLAKNSNYICSAQAAAGEESANTASVSQSSRSANEDQIASSKRDIFNLASTGHLKSIIVILALGVLLMLGSKNIQTND